MLPFTNMRAAGYLPQFFTIHDPRPAKEQLATSYIGGWSPFPGFTLKQRSNGLYFLSYPQDPPMNELSRAMLRDEIIVLFEAEWLAIIQPDGSYEISRVD